MEKNIFERALAEVVHSLQNAENGARIASRAADDQTTADAIRAVIAVHIGDAMQQIQAIIDRKNDRMKIEIGQQIDLHDPLPEKIMLSELAAKLGGGLTVGKC